MNIMKLLNQQDLLQLQKCSQQQQVREVLGRKGVDRQTVVRLVTQLCQEMTVAQYSLQQKQAVVNLTFTFLKELPNCNSKETFSHNLSSEIQKLGKRNSECKVILNPSQIVSLQEFFESKLIPYYELYQIVLDSSPHFVLQAKPSDLVQVTQEKTLSSGSPVDVQSVNALKQFIGIRAPKEEKKDPKKK